VPAGDAHRSRALGRSALSKPQRDPRQTGRHLVRLTGSWVHHEQIDRALSEGPQVVTRKGKRTVVVVPLEERERRVRRQVNLAEFFAA
jgi:hypothetical protein